MSIAVMKHYLQRVILSFKFLFLEALEFIFYFTVPCFYLQKKQSEHISNSGITS